MIFEKTRAAFNPVVQPLLPVEGGETVSGQDIDFGFKNQMVETNEVLEIFVAATATAGQTVTPAEGENPEVITPHAPTLAIKVKTSATGAAGTWETLFTSETFALASLKEGVILVKQALPDKCKEHVQIDLVNASTYDFIKGAVFGAVRPL